MNENLVHANGQKDSQFQVYFSGESYIADTPYFNQSSYDFMLFDATIQLQFQWQYEYNNVKGNFIQSLNKFSFVLVTMYCVVLGCRFYVRRQFYKELDETIRKTDQEVHMQAGVMSQGGK